MMVRDLLSLWGGGVEQMQDGVCAGKVHNPMHGPFQKLGFLCQDSGKISSGKKAHQKQQAY